MKEREKEANDEKREKEDRRGGRRASHEGAKPRRREKEVNYEKREKEDRRGGRK